MITQLDMKQYISASVLHELSNGDETVLEACMKSGWHMLMMRFEEYGKKDLLDSLESSTTAEISNDLHYFHAIACYYTIYFLWQRAQRDDMAIASKQRGDELFMYYKRGQLSSHIDAVSVPVVSIGGAV